MKGIVSVSGLLGISFVILAAAMISGSALAKPDWMKVSMSKLEKELARRGYRERKDKVAPVKKDW